MFTKRIFLFVILALFHHVSVAAESLKCSICGMDFKVGAKTAFESTRDGKPIHFCSFACAHRFHKKFTDAAIFALDFETGNRINASSAFFLIKSKNVLKELDFDMPPTVVAFATEQAAKRAQSRLKDGEVVKGYSSVEEFYK